MRNDIFLKTYLDRFLMLFVVEGDRVGVQVQEVAHFVRNVGPHALVLAVFEPHLDKPLLRAKRKASSNDIWLFKLLAWTQGENSLKSCNLPMSAKQVLSHILSRLSSRLILMIHTPPCGDSCKE
jgi:hypothetical protein